MDQRFCIRLVYYFIGMLSLAIGITLNAKSMLGASPIVSVPFTISNVTGGNFGDLTFGLYTLFVVAQLVIRGKNRRYSDLLQIPFSIVFTRFMNLFSSAIQFPTDTMVQKLAILFAAIFFTGVGAALSVNMKLIANPGDGIVQALSERIGKSMGTTKNIVDCSCVACSCLVGLIFGGNILTGVGLGTFIAMIGVGRVIAVFNHFCKAKMAVHAGLA